MTFMRREMRLKHRVLAGAPVGLLLLTLTLSGCGESAAMHAYATATSEIKALATERSRRSPDDVLRERGEKVYRQYCAICHGETGAGDGFNSFNLKVPPRNLSEAEFWTTTARERTRQVIADGGPESGGSVLMPAWKGTLTGEQIAEVAAYVRRLPEIHAATLAAEEAAAEAEDVEDE